MDIPIDPTSTQVPQDDVEGHFKAAVVQDDADAGGDGQGNLRL